MTEKRQSTPRALVDANVFVSYLLPSRAPGAIAAVVEAAVEGAFTLLLPRELVAEFAASVTLKPYLSQRVSPEDVTALLAILCGVAELIPTIEGPLPIVTRDRKDDYLLAYALVGRADHLVTGDRDLLVLGEVESVRIVRPARFAELLSSGAEAPTTLTSP